MGAATLALAVQAIFLLMPEPKSADAADALAPELASATDSTAFTLAEDATVLPRDTAFITDTATARPPDSTQTAPAEVPDVQPAVPLPVRPDSAVVSPKPVADSTAPGD
jgi:hypothetical protein